VVPVVDQSFAEALEALSEENPEALKADGFDAAFVGYGYRHGSDALAIYDEDKCIKILIERDDMTEEQAVDYFYYNVKGAFVGDGTPIFMTPRSGEGE
tara:strand:+ start:578 stop:871 length:294 start_codon:yes stop_codon:yes gene_type:complete